MAQELIYTSAPRGLRPGSSGFCTVAATGGMSRQAMMKLESLSGYDFLYNLSDERADSNPVNFLHTRLMIGQESQHVLSRIAFSGADHTGRANKIAHHFLLTRHECLPDGPACMLAILDQGGFITHWEGQPRQPEGRDAQSLVVGRSCPSPGLWKRLTGDSGWGGALAAAYRRNPRLPAYVVYQPGTDVLGLFVESLSVLSPEERWAVCFSTYYSPMPVGCPCDWRGVVAGSTGAAEVGKHPNALVIDLTRPIAPTASGEFADAARAGTFVPLASRASTRPPAEDPVVLTQETPGPREDIIHEYTEYADDEPVPVTAVEYQPPGFQEDRPTLRNRRKGIIIAASACIMAALLAAGIIIALPKLSRPAPPETHDQHPPTQSAQSSSAAVELATPSPPSARATQPVPTSQGTRSASRPSSMNAKTQPQSPISTATEPAIIGRADLIEITHGALGILNSMNSKPGLERTLVSPMQDNKRIRWPGAIPCDGLHASRIDALRYVMEGNQVLITLRDSSRNIETMSTAARITIAPPGVLECVVEANHDILRFAVLEFETVGKLYQCPLQKRPFQSIIQPHLLNKNTTDIAIDYPWPTALTVVDPNRASFSYEMYSLDSNDLKTRTTSVTVQGVIIESHLRISCNITGVLGAINDANQLYLSESKKLKPLSDDLSKSKDKNGTEDKSYKDKLSLCELKMASCTTLRDGGILKMLNGALAVNPIRVLDAWGLIVYEVTLQFPLPSK